ncbi:hypothetical protein [Rhodothermus marinus]|uniref:hypothetical protein n=1 Tax=Rhodothermus marinus TaxID=29549 RepID=UPI000B1894DC|nr:hypothetical protein [Rhodothermus marinus]
MVDLLNVMDIGFITQTLDELGRYRLTTKLPEYLAAGLPIAMSPIPGFYDYVYPAGWALPEGHPADPDFHRKLAAWLDGLSREEVRARAARAPALARRFGYDVLRPRFAAFIGELLGVDLSEKVSSEKNSTLMRIACYALVEQHAGSVASANYLILEELLRRGHQVDLFAKADFVRRPEGWGAGRISTTKACCWSGWGRCATGGVRSFVAVWNVWWKTGSIADIWRPLPVG